jgi:outer membrane lipase/esterase
MIRPQPAPRCSGHDDRHAGSKGRCGRWNRNVSGAFRGPALVDSQIIAARFGLTAVRFIVAGGRGTNYANGSAQGVSTTAADASVHGLYDNVPIVTQMSNYLASVHNVANPNALYMISYGGNDLIWLQLQGQNVAALPYLSIQAQSLVGGITSLQAAGARTIVVLDVYAKSKLVDADGGLSPSNLAVVNQATVYSAEVWSGPKAAGVNFTPIDIENALTYASQNPARFGFTAASVLTSNPACGTTTGLVCAPADLVAPNAEQTHLWSDPNHLTTARQTIESDLMYDVITAPSQISLLAETAVQGGLARMATIQGQIDLSGQPRGPNGINTWASAGVSSLSLKNTASFLTESGTAFNGTVGTDYLLPDGVIVGAALTAGGQTQNFSSGGHFNPVTRRSACTPLTGPGRYGATRSPAMACCKTTSHARCHWESSRTRTTPTPAANPGGWGCAADTTCISDRSPQGRSSAW